jgi:nitroreductase
MDQQSSLDLFAAMRKRRMHRAFASEPVPAETMARLVWAAGRGATAKAGIRHIVVVDDPGLMRTLRQACPGFINNAPAAIAICSDLDVCRQTAGKTGTDGVSRIDAGTAAAHLSLAAPALGVGVCFVMAFGDGVVRAILDLPENVRPEILVAVGIPAANRSPAAKAIPQIVHHNAFDTPWQEKP